MRVLFVDDSPVVRATTGRAMAERGIDATVCASVGEARAIDATEIDAALLDLEVGDESGAELAASLRATAPALPIAFLTATASGALYDRARALGEIFEKTAVDRAVQWLLDVQARRRGA